MAAFTVAVTGMVADDQALWSAAAAGAAGVALGGLIRLRDEVTGGTQARQFWLFFCGQVLVEAAGVLTFLIDDGGLASVAGGPAASSRSRSRSASPRPRSSASSPASAAR